MARRIYSSVRWKAKRRIPVRFDWHEHSTEEIEDYLRPMTGEYHLDFWNPVGTVTAFFTNPTTATLFKLRFC